VVAAIRPEDLVIGEVDGNTISVTVRIAEYHGRELSVEAQTSDGCSVYFRTTERVAPGDELVLGIPRHRVLVFGDPAKAREGLTA
jgi:putative spermidine/putrescine transport system ATP-binding protein